jgi:hypothetical protein
VSVLTPEDIENLEMFHPTEDPIEAAPLAVLFDPGAVSAFRASMTRLPKKLGPLVEYSEFDYWVYDQHRNLLQVVAHLRQGNQTLDPSHPHHQALFFDYAWLYALAVSRAVQHIRRAHPVDIDTSLQEYLFGGQLGLREKQQMAQILQRAAGKLEGVDEGVLPSYYPDLLELCHRFLRRPYTIANVLRYLEFLREASVASGADMVARVFGSSYDDLSGKQAADVCGFLVATGGLDPKFRDIARNLLVEVSAPPDQPTSS